jgi:hypothetical protein
MKKPDSGIVDSKSLDAVRFGMEQIVFFSKEKAHFDSLTQREVDWDAHTKEVAAARARHEVRLRDERQHLNN